MLAELIKNGYGDEEGLNCAEKILYGANEVYQLGLDREALKVASGFGGGMGIESVCGAITGAIMAIGCIFADENTQEIKKTRDLSKKFFDKYKAEMGYIECNPLKKEYRTEEKKCADVILKSAEILDDIIREELKR
ncbi:C-GCAxxG-C-C family (seleno)protein [Anaerosalibacter sp. Marseille-P3206]|uniref:C-GCAxxG-C-C family (seleno)protein n=1 Tax=Anaerosalibacter sp. Marseille-P3206 TaxID=1871005 RepID=UPI0009878F0F|nr:C-GCAxxG-C-C family (seleno)protein [Anaerosalibacter sp. Marseille-P3206]